MNAPAVHAHPVDAEDVLHAGASEQIGDLTQPLEMRKGPYRAKSDVPKHGLDDVRIATVERRNFPAEERGRSLALHAEEGRRSEAHGGDVGRVVFERVGSDVPSTVAARAFFGDAAEPRRARRFEVVERFDDVEHSFAHVKQTETARAIALRRAVFTGA